MGGAEARNHVLTLIWPYAVLLHGEPFSLTSNANCDNIHKFNYLQYGRHGNMPSLAKEYEHNSSINHLLDCRQPTALAVRTSVTVISIRF